MKTTVNQIATGTFNALLLLIVNVKAEGTEKTALINESIETTLRLENWMTDEIIWGTNIISFGELYQETETGMKLETWMTNSETWNFDFNYFEETETGMEFENWMINAETWNVTDLNKDAVLTLESWMIDSNIWK